MKSSTLKTHIAMKTSRTTAMKAPATKASTTKTAVTNTDRRHREKTCEYSSKEKLRFHIAPLLLRLLNAKGQRLHNPSYTIRLFVIAFLFPSDNFL